MGPLLLLSVFQQKVAVRAWMTLSQAVRGSTLVGVWQFSFPYKPGGQLAFSLLVI